MQARGLWVAARGCAARARRLGQGTPPPKLKPKPTPGLQLLAAHAQIWQRLGFYKNLKAEARRARRPPPVVGVLGCMAERLKSRLLESDRLVDVVAGPDAYRWVAGLRCTPAAGGWLGSGKFFVICCWLPPTQLHLCSPCLPGTARRDLPRLVDIVQGASGGGGATTPGAGGAMNVQLSADETCECCAQRVAGSAAGGRCCSCNQRAAAVLSILLLLRARTPPRRCVASAILLTRVSLCPCPAVQTRTLCPCGAPTRAPPTCPSCAAATTCAPSASCPSRAAASAPARWRPLWRRCGAGAGAGAWLALAAACMGLRGSKHAPALHCAAGAEGRKHTQCEPAPLRQPGTSPELFD